MTVMKIHWLTMSYWLTFKYIRLDKCTTLGIFDHHLPALEVFGVILNRSLWTDELLPSLDWLLQLMLTSEFWMSSCLPLLTFLLSISSEMPTGDPALMPPPQRGEKFLQALRQWAPPLNPGALGFYHPLLPLNSAALCKLPGNTSGCLL